MRRLFIEISSFRKEVDAGGPELLRHIQDELLERIDGGSVIQGTGGLRKQRISDSHRGKGKRGGYRVIYLDLPDLEKTYLLDLYGKDEKDDLSAADKKVLKQLATQLKKEARRNG